MIKREKWRRAPRAVLAVLFVGGFVMGTSELLIVGVLDRVAHDVDVSTSAAGFLVSAYALALAFGGPLLTALSASLDRRTVLLAALATSVVTNFATVLTNDYATMLVSRVLTGAAQGLFLAASFAIAAAVLPAERAGRGFSVVISGIAVSTALGVPLGTLVGQTVGWSNAYIAVTCLIGLTLLLAAAITPGVAPSRNSLRGQVRYAFAPRVLAVLVLCALVFAATYAALTYLEPILETITGVSAAAVSGFLLIYGAAAALGSLCSGRFADHNASRALVAGTIGVTMSLALIYLFATTAVFVALFLIVLGACTMGMGPSLQHRIVGLAGPGGQLAQSLPASGINLGIALGSLLGGFAVGQFAADAAITTGLVIGVIAIPVAMATSLLRSPPSPEPGFATSTASSTASSAASSTGHAATSR